MKENIVANKSFAFAVRIVKLYKYLCGEKHEFVLAKQLLCSGTIIGANIHEATQGQSKRDFLSKMNIALKEAAETEYWIKLLVETDFITKQQEKSILDDCIEINKLLHAIVKTTKKETQCN